MKIPKHTKLLLWILLITLNIVLRYPATSHEIGWDSYNIHILANSISEFGQANYWESPFSIFGLYPLSYASAVPFSLSGISQLSGVNMELVTLLFSTSIGLFSLFPIYLVAGEIRNDDFFKFATAFLYSISEGMLFLTTWTVSTRGLFVVLLPLLVYSLIKCHSSLRYGIISLIVFILLVSTHHLFFYTLPLIVGFIVIEVAYRFHDRTNYALKYSSYVDIIIIVFSLIMFLIPFFSRSLWSEDPEIIRQSLNGSRYAVLLALFSHYTRYIGLLIFFAGSGYTYLLLKRSKSLKERYLLVTLAGLAPFLYTPTYMKWFILPFAFLLIGEGIANLIQTYSPYRKYIAHLVTFLLVISVCFSGYYQFMHFSPDDSARSMQESTYLGGLWIKENIEGNLFYDNGLVALRTFAISEVPTLFGDDIGLSYGFYTSVNDLNLTENSPLSIDYYIDGPVVKTLGTPYIEGDINQLHMSTYNSTRGTNFINRYNLSYVIDYIHESNTFINSVNQDKSKLYDNGEISLWELD